MTMKTPNSKHARKIPRWATITLIVSIALNIVGACCLVANHLVTREALSVVNDDYLVVNNGLRVLCSSEFRDKVAEQYRSQGNMSENSVLVALANIDYSCNNSDSKRFFIKGFEEYLDSQNLEYTKGDFD